MASYEPFGSVLVTGGCGFVGRNLVKALKQAQPDCNIVVLDVNTSSHTIPGVEYHAIDISDEPAMRAVFSSLAHPPRVIFHIACPPPLARNHDAFYRVNVDGTRLLLSLAQGLGTVKAFVYCSSSSVIHDNVSDLVDADETLPVLKPPVQKRVYTLTKALAEEECLAANRAHGMLTLAIRPCTTFGPGDFLLSARVVNNVRTGRARYQLGEGKNDYDFTYIENLVHAFLLAASRLLQAADAPALPPGDPMRIEGEAFNISNDERVPFWGFTLLMAEAWGTPVSEKELVKIPLWVGLILGFVTEWATWILTLGKKEPAMSVETVGYTYKVRTINIEKAKRVLGYKPLYSMREGIQKTAEWFKEQERKSQ
ncbi:hypothetical protein C8Q76DRAFT_695155 [Earliella scabrosa]|nr:hypothetical protein C8Q76DRAFT_695155 [Earliella scabrosa]